MDIKELKINLKDEKLKNESNNSMFLNLKEEKQQIKKKMDGLKADIEKKDKLIK